MMRQMRWRWFVFVGMVVMLVGLSGVSWGNGVYIPQQAYPALPGIPVQRAVIVYRDGVQTLVVESAFQTESADVAWILPLPGVPVKLEVGDAGMVSSACMAMRVKITHDLHGLWYVPLWALALIGPFMLVRIRTTDHDRRHTRYVRYGFSVVVLVLWIAILLPSLSHGGDSTIATAGVQIHSTQRLGDYECTVLSSPDARELSGWLEERSLRPLDGEAQAVVADYISRGWCFVVTELRAGTAAGGREVAVPRPLVARFKTQTPVFPMKATGLAKTKTRVELCVIADQEAVAAGFESPAAVRFVRVDEGGVRSPYYESTSKGLRMGSPDVVGLMWDGCVVTKLQADLLPEQMGADVVIGFRPLRGVGHRDHFFSEAARREIVGTVLLSAVVVGLLIAAVVYRHGRKASRGQRRFLFGVVGVIVGAGVALL